MKQTAFAFAIALGVVIPGLTNAATPANDANAVFQRDLAVWNGAGFKAVVTQQISRVPHYEYDSIYRRDLASTHS